MKQNTILKAQENEVPIPSHFSQHGFTTSALDNKDWDDNSSLSDTQGKHQAVMTLYQETTQPPAPKKNISELGIDKCGKSSKELLSCQIVPPHEKPIVRPTLPADFPLAENYDDLVILKDADQASAAVEQREFAITLARSSVPNSNPEARKLPPSPD